MEDEYFAFLASLRIHGENLPFQEIEESLGINATYFHRKGDRKGPRSPAYSDDAWHFSPPISESDDLTQHIDALWKVLKPNASYLRVLKKTCKVDVFCGYRTNCDHAGISVPSNSLEMFVELEIPFGLSIIVT